MNIDIYQSCTNGYKFISVPAGFDVTTITLPTPIDSDYKTVGLFKKNIPLQPGMIALDEKITKNDIAQNGFSLHSVKYSSNIII